MLVRKSRRIPNWRAPGLDGVQGYWRNNFSSLHHRRKDQLHNCVQGTTSVPKWMTSGRTTLIMKDKNKGIVASNFRQISCLPLMWKMVTGMIADNLYNYLEDSGLLPKERKGCRKRSRGAKDQLLVDRMVIGNCKRRVIGLGMAWIDYKKAFDFLPHTWNLECLKRTSLSRSLFQIFWSKSQVEGWLQNRPQPSKPVFWWKCQTHEVFEIQMLT